MMDCNTKEKEALRRALMKYPSFIEACPITSSSSSSSRGRRRRNSSRIRIRWGCCYPLKWRVCTPCFSCRPTPMLQSSLFSRGSDASDPSTRPRLCLVSSYCCCCCCCCSLLLLLLRPCCPAAAAAAAFQSHWKRSCGKETPHGTNVAAAAAAAASQVQQQQQQRIAAAAA